MSRLQDSLASPEPMSPRDMSSSQNNPEPDPAQGPAITGHTLALPLGRGRRALHEACEEKRHSRYLFSEAIGNPAGYRPGDLTTDFEYSKTWQECTIKVLEYSAVTSRNSPDLKNQQFIDFLKTEPEGNFWMNETGQLPNVELMKKHKKRWIIIYGISWDVINALASKYCS